MWQLWLAFAARLAWCLPFVLCFFPERIRDEKPRSPVAKVVHVLVDDSESMKLRVGASARLGGNERRSEVASRIVADAAAVCRDAGCEIKSTLLSELDSSASRGFSWIERGLNAWRLGLGTDPWILVSDGGDSAQNSGISVENRATVQGPGLIVGFQPADPRNLFFGAVTVPPYAFDGRPAQVTVHVARGDGINRTAGLPQESVQVQVRSGNQVLSAVDVSFKEGEAEASARIVLPALPRGEQPLEFFILPSPDEAMVWDNSLVADVEVLPNTLGLLHLLGSPGWDGRFFRRLVKSEPKFDLISFFILRDPWDNLQVSDRELSLIPFPAERLFKEELQSFRVLVLHDFTLAQFLQPDYQANLVQFVKNGGGLLFIGGPRALHRLDMASSPLREILPFTPGAEAILNYPRGRDAAGGLDSDSNSNSISSSANVSDPGGGNALNQPQFAGAGFDTLGAAYDGTRAFKIEFAKPAPEQRELASVYDDWLATTPDLTRVKGLKGLHVIPPALVDATRTTPLLNARLADGSAVPLALASFPGRGRALWILSDSMWRMAMAENSGIARETYDRFMLGGIQWLLRQDLRKPLVANRFAIRSGGPDAGRDASRDVSHDVERDTDASQSKKSRAILDWSVHVSGPATHHLDFLSSDDEKRWRLSICGVMQDSRAISVARIASDQFVLSGTLASGAVPALKDNAAGGTRPFCKVEIEALHKSFGSVKSVSSAFIHTPLNDSEARDSVAWLRKVQEREGASTEMILVGASAPYESPGTLGTRIGRWLRANASSDENSAGDSAVAIEPAQPAREDPYWPFRHWWSWALMAMMPVEVLARRLRRTFN